ncbi:hypothetical protein V1J52_13570 [Streptomyces sp. TRM 70351]|uniref:hypothetical protein n=1 Tax=Streptomyces sp. TRM 70351 TaxID=3116552 RepID=UPI002E7BB389|nr:hypothetical protein [Streptomyces sp. TRM 70351]MEE1929194.1 hypothetical protein [Streptomyces sp. TRM 70351]
MAVLAVLLAGCAGGGTADGGPGPGEVDPRHRANWPTTDRGGLVAGLSLPLEEYLVAYPDYVAAENARIAAIDACMDRYGFEYAPTPFGEYPPPSVNGANLERRYGVSDRAAAETYGYRLPAAVAGEPDSYEPPGGDAAYVVLRGTEEAPPGTRASGDVPEGGCAGEVDRAMGRLDDHFASDLDGESLRRSEEDPAVREAIAAWSDCMSAKGYRVTHPYEADELVPPVLDEPPPEEITAAVADVGCKAGTDLIRIWSDVEREIQQELIEENAPVLNELREANERVLKRVARS